MNQNDIRTAIEAGHTALGIEFGSTRIKAVLVGAAPAPLKESQGPPNASLQRSGQSMATTSFLMLSPAVTPPRCACEAQAATITAIGQCPASRT